VRSGLANDARNLKVHESIVTNIRRQVGATRNREGAVFVLESHRKSLLSKTSGRSDKVSDRIANPRSVIRIGNKNHFRALVAENTTLQEGRLLGTTALEETPLCAGFEKGFNAERGSPLEIPGGVLSIAETSGNRNDSLMLIVGERNEDVNNAGMRLRKGRTACQNSQRNKTNKNGDCE
jgi:hypothetical protein